MGYKISCEYVDLSLTKPSLMLDFEIKNSTTQLIIILRLDFQYQNLICFFCWGIWHQSHFQKWLFLNEIIFILKREAIRPLDICEPLNDFNFRWNLLIQRDVQLCSRIHDKAHYGRFGQNLSKNSRDLLFDRIWL